ncbi:RNA polymerase sigma factor [Maricaulis sp.]|uniref:RNA polymerase sigma factor n=1 Tax=Maricaulis sp. TaxID=1486257 RepID=UPI002603A941|nr:RNA polymerase sigma factor [Maricaulis sp.]
MNDELISILPRLRRFAISLAGDRSEGDDLLQKVVERLLTRSVPDNADLLRWSFRICRNIWIDEVRSRKVRSHVAVEEMSDQLRGEDGEVSAMARLTLRDVNAALDALPDDQRVALVLVAVEGFSYAETAQTLDVPVGTVMSRVARARKALAGQFGDDPVLTQKGASHELH